MRREARILLVTAGLGAIVSWGDQWTHWLEDRELFRIREVEVHGLRYLSRGEAIDLLGLTPESSVWNEEGIWRDRVLNHPLIKEARISRRLPNKLRLTVRERTPIALAPTPTLEPVDAEGYRLPIDPAEYRLDLPVIQTSLTPPRSSRLVPEDVRRLVAEVEHLMASDTTFLQLVSSVEWDERGAVVVRWTEPSVVFLLPPRLPPARLREGLGALADAVSRSPDRMPISIDLRFADQVVVRRTPSTTGF